MNTNTATLAPQTLSDVMDQADRSGLLMSRVRSAMLSPTSRKRSPVYSSGQLGAICGLDRNQVAYRLQKSDLPAGRMLGNGRREFSLSDVQTWARAYRGAAMRPAGAEAVTMVLANFKGGVGKTTTAMSVAQGLSLRGHRVLAVDCDPQGSLTTLFGILPDTEVEDEQTILPLCVGAESSLRSAIRPSYWSGVDLVAAAPLLFGAEFSLPSRQQTEDDFEFWNVLNVGLDEVRDEYDVIVIDTPPSLSYVTINALMAANGLLMPLPPNALDFASASQFWRLFSDLAGQLVEQRGVGKEFDFIRVLLTRVDSSDSTATVVRDWIGQTYEGKVMPVEIPKTAAAASAAAEFGTIYDVGKYDGNARTYKRAAEAYEKVTELVEQLIQATWRRKAAAA
ncbi:ParA family protein [Azohydromonas lata]|uniref:AAA family ATPase n=1 Tax=Azohydromonas lata TaxID=45677 RepID=A0ABU5IAA7_9BURK|nr:AAA family ATPase [Azohydromonas lata]MDZ5456044.1 AAA family ATPase [Azohydromonas lata]